MIQKRLPTFDTPRPRMSLQELIDRALPDPTLLDGTTWDRKDYDHQEAHRIYLRRCQLLDSFDIDERVFELTLSMRQQSDIYDEARLLLIDPRFDEVLQHLGHIRKEETAVSRAWLEKRIACTLCGGQRVVYRLDGVCESCHRSIPSTPPIRGIASAVSRARRVKMPATLTEDEWRRTIEHFKDRCAYCEGPWSLVEHATPIPRGGTTADNCLPSCASCNNSKSGATIEELEPTEYVQAALDWLHLCGRPGGQP